MNLDTIKWKCFIIFSRKKVNKMGGRVKIQRMILIGCIIFSLLLIAPLCAGNTVTIVGRVVVPNPLIADFIANQTNGYAPLTVQFTNLSSGFPTEWGWDFENDGIIDDTLPNPVHTYTLSGVYSVSLTVWNTEGSNSETKLNYITVQEPDPFVRIGLLKEYIQELPISGWAQWFLIRPLNRGFDQLEKGHVQPAINQINVFIQFVEQIHGFHILSNEQAEYLIGEARAIINLLQE